MKIAFYGSSDFSLQILKKLYSFHQIDKVDLKYVVSQPAKPFGRKRELRNNPVAQFCLENNIQLLTPDKIAELKLHDLNVDISFVAAYGKILPKWLLGNARYGFVNFHGSLLPKYRGAAPVQFCVLKQDIEATGVTLIKMDEGMDTGQIINNDTLKGTSKLIISREQFGELTSGELMVKLGELSVDILEKDFDYIFNPEEWNLVEQNESLASYCYVSDMAKENFEVKYADGVKLAHGKIMAANPEPKAFGSFRIKEAEYKINLLRSKFNLADQDLSSLKKTGELMLHFDNLNKKLYLELFDGFLQILEIQTPAGKVVSGNDFGNGFLSSKE
jgi:methionyl-tRNA formyltransferase